jgi:hypothetical protein
MHGPALVAGQRHRRTSVHVGSPQRDDECPTEIVGGYYAPSDTCTHCASLAYALVLQKSPAFVDRNNLVGGCADTAYGLYGTDVAGRVQNNTIYGVTETLCNGHTPNPQRLYDGYGTWLTFQSSSPDVDYDSNYTDGGLEGDYSLCLSNTSGANAGVLRNNTIQEDYCTFCAPSPRIDEGNSTCLGSSCYDPTYTKDLGVTTDAPLWDLHGNPRDDGYPDIGPVEY